MFLLIDNSNSFTKLALSSATDILRIRKIPTREVSPETLEKALRGWKFDSVVLCSVVPAKAAVLAAYLAEKKKPVIKVSAKINLGIGIDYPKPASIGADRLANTVSATAFYGGPAVVVDFGTAVTFDVISADNNYMGGVIAPGLEAMTDYLHERTALLPKISLLEPPAAIGKSTRKAMLSGAVYGYRGLVRQILVELARELGVEKGLTVVATGGYAELIGAGLPEIGLIRPDLTLQGLRIIGTLNPVGKP